MLVCSIESFVCVYVHSFRPYIPHIHYPIQLFHVAVVPAWTGYMYWERETIREYMEDNHVHDCTL